MALETNQERLLRLGKELTRLIVEDAGVPVAMLHSYYNSAAIPQAVKKFIDDRVQQILVDIPEVLLTFAKDEADESDSASN